MKFWLFLIASLAVSCSWFSKDPSKLIPKTKVKLLKPVGKFSLFEFKKLDGEILAKSGDIEIKKSDLQKDTALDELSEKHKELLQQVKKGSIKKNDYNLARIESELFRRQLFLIEDKMKKMALFKEAKKQKLQIHEYLKEYVFVKVKDEIPSKQIEKFKKENPIPDVVDKNDWIKKKIVENQKGRSRNYFIEKFLLKLPIQVNLKPPHQILDVNFDWVPHLGPEKSELSLHVFADTKSHANMEAVKAILEAAKRYSGLFVGYHPLFAKDNYYQIIGVNMGFCIWKSHPDKYFDFLRASLGDHQVNTEANLYKIAEKQGFSKSDIQQCIAGREFIEVMDYHHQYNQFLGIEAGPVVYINGEVLSGFVTEKDIHKVICRKLKFPCAGGWSL